ncbi:MAG: acetate/propionate family kinase [Pseudomonadota bacterium]
MSATVLTLNAGSSSLKFGLFALSAEPTALAEGAIEAIGAQPRLRVAGPDGAPLAEAALEAAAAETPGAAAETALARMRALFPEREIAVVGHRVVHGGPVYAEPVVVTDAVLEELARYSAFAPLHQPHNLAGVRAARAAHPGALQIACFDTSFHRNHPWVNDVFALPRAYYDKGVRRYGFHGLSYDYVSGALAAYAPHLHAGRVVIAHLGNGASMCGLLGGRSIGSTMGFSALDGLPMGTRCGQLDPGVVLYLMEQEGLGPAEVADLLYKKSGLLGLSGLSNDMRTLEQAGTPEAEQAIAYFVFRIRRELGALAAVLGGLDAVVFCGGIGERSSRIRAQICEGTQWLGLELDRAANAEGRRVISTELSRVRALVIPTNEELVIARAARRFLDAGAAAP